LAFKLLRCQVRRRAERARDSVDALIRQPARQPEIGQVHVLLRVEEDARRFDVPMDEAAGVGCVQGRGDLPADPHRTGRIERAIPP
jgi:hypothetical protein